MQVENDGPFSWPNYRHNVHCLFNAFDTDSDGLWNFKEYNTFCRLGAVSVVNNTKAQFLDLCQHFGAFEGKAIDFGIFWTLYNAGWFFGRGVVPDATPDPADPGPTSVSRHNTSRATPEVAVAARVPLFVTGDSSGSDLAQHRPQDPALALEPAPLTGTCNTVAIVQGDSLSDQEVDDFLAECIVDAPNSEVSARGVTSWESNGVAVSSGFSFLLPVPVPHHGYRLHFSTENLAPQDSTHDEAASVEFSVRFRPSLDVSGTNSRIEHLGNDAAQDQAPVLSSVDTAAQSGVEQLLTQRVLDASGASSGATTGEVSFKVPGIAVLCWSILPNTDTTRGARGWLPSFSTHSVTTSVRYKVSLGFNAESFHQVAKSYECVQWVVFPTTQCRMPNCVGCYRQSVSTRAAEVQVSSPQGGSRVGQCSRDVASLTLCGGLQMYSTTTLEASKRTQTKHQLEVPLELCTRH